MNKKILLLLGGLFFIFGYGCRNDNKDAKNVMNRKEFISILIDIHRADALFGYQSLFDAKIKNPDSLSYYNDIFKQYDITREEFYNTVVFYLQNMNNFIEIQAVVIDSLTKELDYLDSLELISLEQRDLWPLKREWLMPEDGITNDIAFNIPMRNAGNYKLIAKIISYPDDKSKGLKMRLLARYSDSSVVEKEVRIAVRKTSWVEYTAEISTNPDKKLVSIEGQITSHSPKTTFMHLSVKDIMLTYAPTKDATSNDDSVEVKAPQ